MRTTEVAPAAMLLVMHARLFQVLVLGGIGLVNGGCGGVADATTPPADAQPESEAPNDAGSDGRHESGLLGLSDASPDATSDADVEAGFPIEK